MQVINHRQSIHPEDRALTVPDAINGPPKGEPSGPTVIISANPAQGLGRVLNCLLLKCRSLLNKRQDV